MQIFDTLGNKKTELEFSDKVRIYLCGVTVYNDAHIGHARTIIVFDILRRFLESQKIPVELVQNFTDVDDKIINAAQVKKIGPLQLSAKYTENYFAEFDRLNVKRATVYPKASEHIEDMQKLISELMAKGYTYEKKEGIYFSVSKFPEYGKLSKRNINEPIPSKKLRPRRWLHKCTRCRHKWDTNKKTPENCEKCKSKSWNHPLISAAQREFVAAYKIAMKKQVEMRRLGGATSVNMKKYTTAIEEAKKGIENEDAKKEVILDFALWKFYDRYTTWTFPPDKQHKEPWGEGRPGWHIECSAMSLKYLGENFEIHGGGRDLITTHHENEIAQSESITSKQFAKIWMHVGMITINGEKMSRSIGNIKSVSYVLKNWGPNIIRLFCLSGHYTKPIDYSEKLLEEKITKLRQIESCYYELRLAEGTSKDTIAKKIVKEFREEFDSALNDDLNTPLALTAFYKLTRKVNSLAAEEKITQTYAEIILPEFERVSDILGIQIIKVTDEEKNEINQMIKKRDEYRVEKNYDEADKIREQIARKNIIFVDHKNKTRWIKQEKIKAE